MNPHTGQTPLDYLNQISPAAPKRQLFTLNLRTIILLAIAAIVLVIILIAVVNTIAGSQKQPWQQFTARLAATATIVDDAGGHIKNSQLRSLNSDVKLYITNTQRDLATPLAARGIDPKKLPASITAAETGTGMAGRLEDGRLNAKYDSTYAREMTYQLATTLALLQKLYAMGGSTETKNFLQTAYNNLLPTYQTISKFSASNE